MKLNFAKLGRGMAIAALGCSSVIAVTAFAQGPGGMGMGPHHPPMERAMGPQGDHGRWWNEPKAIEKFKLSETQRKAMDDIYQQHRVNLVDLHATLQKSELALEPLIRTDDPDEGKILAQIDRVAQARAELEKANARMLLGIRKQLTPDQWKQLEAARAARHDKGRDHEEGMRSHGKGPGMGGMGMDKSGPEPPSGPGPNDPGIAAPGADE